MIIRMENETHINETNEIEENNKADEIMQMNAPNMQQTMQNVQKTRVHRIGTITFGVSLLSMGILFLLHMFFPMISYQTIYQLWPVIFIMLGIEILILNYKEKRNALIYDKAGVFLMFCMMTFAMIMGIMEQIIHHIQVFY